MRIDKIEIDGFGKLNNFSVELKDGFNLIFGENESGKSTLCTFLLSMFYEMPNDSKKLELKESIRQKYRPWNSERFGGRVTFTHEEKTYVLEKSFGTTKRSDRAKLVDAESWDECGDAENVGERFFGLGRDGFLKTLYMTGLSAEAKGMGDEEILSKLSNLETSGDEDVSYVNIKNALEKEKFSILTKTGKGGKLASLQDKEKELLKERAEALYIYNTLKNDEACEKELKEKIEKIKARLKATEKAHILACEHENYLMQKKGEETKSVISERLKSEEEIKDEYIKERKLLLEKKTETVEKNDIDKAKILEKDLVIYENKYEELLSKVEEAKEKNESSAKKINKISVIYSFVTLFLFLLVGIILKPYISFYIFGIMGVLISVLVFYASIKVGALKGDNLKNINEEYEKAREELLSTREKIDTLCEKYNKESLNALFEYASSLDDTEDEIEKLNSKILESENEIKTLLNNLNKLSETKEREFSDDAKSYEGESVYELLSTINKLKEMLDKYTKEHYDLSLELAKKTSSSKSVSDIDSYIGVVSEKIKELKKQYDAYEKASEWLFNAHNEIKNNYAPRLNKKTTEIFSCLTDKKYDGVKAGEGFKLNYKNENNEIVDGGHLSGGTYDLLYIALRLASLSVLFDGNIPPIISDDALLQADDKRLKKTVDFLCENEEFGQIIYFTCHKSSIGIFENEKINKIEI